MNGILIDPALLAEAEALEIDVAQAEAQGVRDAVRATAERRWREANRAALHSSNAYVERNGLPLDSHRLF